MQIAIGDDPPVDDEELVEAVLPEDAVPPVPPVFPVVMLVAPPLPPVVTVVVLVAPPPPPVFVAGFPPHAASHTGSEENATIARLIGLGIMRTSLKSMLRDEPR